MFDIKYLVHYLSHFTYHWVSCALLQLICNLICVKASIHQETIAPGDKTYFVQGLGLIIELTIHDLFLFQAVEQNKEVNKQKKRRLLLSLRQGSLKPNNTLSLRAALASLVIS